MIRSLSRTVLHILKPLSAAALILSLVLGFSLMPSKTALAAPEPAVSVQEENGGYTVRVEGITDAAKVLIPVWTAANGQDDIVWYTASSDGDAWKVTVYPYAHKNEGGSYIAHVYTQDAAGNLAFAAHTKFEAEAPEITVGASITALDAAAGTYTITVIPPAGTTEVMIPTWTAKGGQDDIVWYSADAAEDAYTLTVQASRHHYGDGIYWSHVYARSADGSLTLLTALSAELHPEVKGGLSVTPNEDQTVYTIALTNSPEPYLTMRMAVWGSDKGQNDLRWYEASRDSDGNWSTSVAIADHKEQGTYNCHVYAQKQDGSMALIDHTTFEISVITGTPFMQIVNVDEDGFCFDVVISDLKVPAGIQLIRVPVWTSADGQDDLIWYEAKSADTAPAGAFPKGSWVVHVDTANHKNQSGNYIAHLYVTDTRGFTVFGGNTSEKITVYSSDPELTAKVNDDRKTVTLELKHIRDAETVSFSVWGTQNGQNDLASYEARKVNGNTWRGTVRLVNHMETGKYTAQAQVKYTSGAENTPASADFTIEKLPPNVITFSDKDDVNGRVSITINNVEAAESIKNVRFAIWTETNGQDDLKWVDATQTGSNWNVLLDAADHNSESGIYIVHAYAISGADKPIFLDGSNTKLTYTARVFQNPEGWYQIQDTPIQLGGGGYDISYGYEGLKVAKVHQYFGMNWIGMNSSLYSTTTQTLVSTFQYGHGLPQTGIVDLATWKAMGFTESEWYSRGAYVSPLKVDRTSTRADHVEAMISRAYEYLGNPYVIGASGAPGLGCDCSGLVMQALYAAGIDASPINPVRHAYPGYEYESRNLWSSPYLKHVDYSQRQRGDLIFYHKNGVVIHVAIYLGNDQVIESWPNQVMVCPIVNSSHPNVLGVARVFANQ